MSDADELERIDAEILALTGERYHLYTSQPDRQLRVVFKDGVKFGYQAGVAHARRFLHLMQHPQSCGNEWLHGPHEWSQGKVGDTAVGCLGKRQSGE